jgi:hypothetical protein
VGAPNTLGVVLANPVDPKPVEGAGAGAPNIPPVGAGAAPNVLAVDIDPNAGVVVAVDPNPLETLPNPPVVLPNPPVPSVADEPNPPPNPPPAGAGVCPNMDVPEPNPLGAGGEPNKGPPCAGAGAPNGVDDGAPNPPEAGAP